MTSMAVFVVEYYEGDTQKHLDVHQSFSGGVRAVLEKFFANHEVPEFQVEWFNAAYVAEYVAQEEMKRKYKTAYAEFKSPEWVPSQENIATLMFTHTHGGGFALQSLEFVDNQSLRIYIHKNKTCYITSLFVERTFIKP
jgi:hypothetical protein